MGVPGGTLSSTGLPRKNVAPAIPDSGGTTKALTAQGAPLACLGGEVDELDAARRAGVDDDRLRRDGDREAGPVQEACPQLASPRDAADLQRHGPILDRRLEEQGTARPPRVEPYPLVIRSGERPRNVRDEGAGDFPPQAQLQGRARGGIVRLDGHGQAGVGPGDRGGPEPEGGPLDLDRQDRDAPPVEARPEDERPLELVDGHVEDPLALAHDGRVQADVFGEEDLLRAVGGHRGPEGPLARREEPRDAIRRQDEPRGGRGAGERG